MRAAYEFTEVVPSTASYWRGIVLFGRNVASYKFALAETILELAGEGREAVSLEELAQPFSERVCAHLRNTDKQATSSRSRFLDACRKYNRGELDHASLLDATAKLGFQNVIDAFHVVGDGPVPERFFIDERRSSTRGICLTDSVLELAAETSDDLESEAEARWRLVETAWELNLPREVLRVSYDPDGELLLPAARARRKAITGARDALNGYQKGHCFYCFGSVRITAGSAASAEVDHFFPHLLKRTDLGSAVNFDGVWNLVLACRACNGSGGKSGSVPDLHYVERLHKRNEFLIASHHPLRPTLMAQTGATERERGDFLNYVYREAKQRLLSTWLTAAIAPAVF